MNERLNEALSDRYRIERELGAGGMATVYLAHDLKHDRKVAVKVLRPELAAVIGADRFLAEIKTTANLQHPHILALFDSGQVEGTVFYVMPYVEGESLRDRISREKQLPIDDAIRIAREVADALQYAHQHKVIHRDIKPENILLHGGHALVADFGIALAASKTGGTRMTETGMSLGTPHYMSPEQAMGERDLDARTDIYALGCVTYEMLTGEPPFSGPTAQAIVAKVMTERPASIMARRDRVPEHVEDAVLTALEKLPADRYASAAQFAEGLLGTSTGVTPRRTSQRMAASAARVRWRDPAFVALGLVAVAATAGAIWLASHRAATATADPVTFVVTAKGVAQPAYTYTWPALVSPDGKTLVYAGAAGNGHLQLYLREIGQLEARPVPGSEAASQAIFSPNSQWLAFQSQGAKLVKVSVGGGALIPLMNYGEGNGATWTSRGEIVVGAGANYLGLSRVPDGGGTPKPLTKPDTGGGKKLWHVWPVALPDGHNVVFSIWNSLDRSTRAADLAIASLDDGVVHPLGIRAARPLGMAGDFLVYLQSDGVVMASRVDLSAHHITGTAVPVLDSIPMCPVCNGDGAVTLSSSGAIAYMRGAARSRLTWVSSQGEVPIYPDPAVFLNPRLSPAGDRIAAEVDANGRKDIWILDLKGNTLSPLTTTGDNSNPEWTGDGKYVDFGSDRGGESGIWREPSDGSGEAKLLVSGRTAKVSLWGAMSSPDKSHMLLQTVPNAAISLSWLASGTDSVMHPYVMGSFNAWGSRFSPDGKLVAFVSDESGRAEVYIRSFPDPGARVPVSVSGGREPMWSADGKSLFYAAGNQMTRASLVLHPTVSVGTRDSLFSVPYFGSYFEAPAYDVASDGKRFLMLKPSDEHLQLVVTMNWAAELAKRLGKQ